MGGMGARSAPMDDALDTQLVHGRPSATHAPQFEILRMEIEGEALG